MENMHFSSSYTVHKFYALYHKKNKSTVNCLIFCFCLLIQSFDLKQISFFVAWKIYGKLYFHATLIIIVHFSFHTN